MSNQVYANERTKYYDYPGLNLYNNSGVQTVAAGATDQVNIPITTINNYKNNYTFDMLGNMSIINDGMYSIVLTVHIETTDPMFELFETIFISLDRAPEFTDLEIVRDTKKAPATDTGVFHSVSATFYVKKGDVVKFLMTNNSLTIDYKIVFSQLFVNRIY
jgi:hypothetical protein